MTACEYKTSKAGIECKKYCSINCTVAENVKNHSDTYEERQFTLNIYRHQQSDNKQTQHSQTGTNFTLNIYRHLQSDNKQTQHSQTGTTDRNNIHIYQDDNNRTEY